MNLLSEAYDLVETLGVGETTTLLQQRARSLAPRHLIEFFAALKEWPTRGAHGRVRRGLELHLTPHVLGAATWEEATRIIPAQYRAALGEAPRTLNVRTDPRPTRYGACSALDETHHQTLFSRTNKHYGRATRILLGNTLIGTIKRVGEAHSFLALRNVIDAEGRLALVRGGVYSTDRRTTRRAERMKDHYAALSVQHFSVRPIRMLDPRQPHSFATYLSNLMQRRRQLERLREL
ncbi:hypothetical protein D6789_00315 [Candidatus Woesearchaeota archaeon]|nr:MAG: hypothetical protein D6789_00315 [Candidatus Woesearchaeota archaeon]